MEGSYMPSYHRAKIIKEVRNTHFHFGNDPKEYKTTNFTDFKGKATSVSITKIKCVSPFTTKTLKRL